MQRRGYNNKSSMQPSKLPPQKVQPRSTPVHDLVQTTEASCTVDGNSILVSLSPNPSPTVSTSTSLKRRDVIVLRPKQIHDYLVHGVDPFFGGGVSSMRTTINSSVLRNGLIDALHRYWPRWFKNIVITSVLHKVKTILDLSPIVGGGGDGEHDSKRGTSAKTIGEGRFGKVQQLTIESIPIAVKRVDHAKNGGSGNTEYYMLNALREAVLVPRLSENIIWLYKYVPGSTFDLVLLERASCNLWAKLREGKAKSRYVKAVLFQALHVLTLLYNTVVGFRHNDLKDDNVLLIEGEMPSAPFKDPHGGAKRWAIKERVIVKIADFDFACSSSIRNPKVDTTFSRQFGCESTPNEHYDAHLFLNSVYRHRETLPKDITTWIESKIPSHLRGDDTTMYLKYGRLVKPESHVNELSTARDLLMDRFFDVFSI